MAAFVAAVSLFVWNLNNDPWLPLSLAEPGTCFQDSQSSLIVRHDARYEVRTTIEVVDCGAPHQFEAIGTVAMSGFGDTTSMAADADALCAGVFEDYVGAPPGGAGPWQMASFPPYLMFLAGDRAHCLAYQGTYLGATDDPYDPVMVEGTARRRRFLTFSRAGSARSSSPPRARAPRGGRPPSRRSSPRPGHG